MELEMSIKTYKEANETLKKKLALTGIKEEPISNPKPLQAKAKAINISYEHALAVIGDVCAVMEVASPFDLVETITKFKRLLNAIPRMEKFISEIRNALQIQEIDQIIPELERLRAANPNFKNKVCHLLLKDPAKATEAELLDKINELLINEKGNSKSLTIQTHKIEVIESLEQILQTDWTDIIDCVTQLLLTKKRVQRICRHLLQ